MKEHRPSGFLSLSLSLPFHPPFPCVFLLTCVCVRNSDDVIATLKVRVWGNSLDSLDRSSQDEVRRDNSVTLLSVSLSVALHCCPIYADNRVCFMLMTSSHCPQALHWDLPGQVWSTLYYVLSGAHEQKASASPKLGGTYSTTNNPFPPLN